MHAKLWTTKLSARAARAAIYVLAFAAPALAAWFLSDDYAGLWSDSPATIGAIALAAAPVVSQVIGNYAGKLQAWLQTQK